MHPSNAPPTHPTTHPPGKLYFFRYTFDAPPYVTAGVLDAGGGVEASVPLDLPRPVMMHDMAISQSYMVFMDHPLVFDGEVRPTGGHTLFIITALSDHCSFISHNPL